MAGCSAKRIAEDKLLKIEILSYVNFSVNMMGTMVILVIIVCLSTGENRENKLNKLLICGLFACITYMGTSEYFV